MSLMRSGLKMRSSRNAPKLWPETHVLRAWPETAERLGKHGLTLNSWTIGMFQPWIVLAYPETARVLPFGEVPRAGTCPANPAVLIRAPQTRQGCPVRR